MYTSYPRSILDTNAHVSRDIAPRIGGSTAAFIAVVVILVLIIATCCVAVVYILRQEAQEEELARRRRYQAADDPREHADSSPQPPITLYSRLVNVFRLGSKIDENRPTRSRPPVKGNNQGWIQAGHGGEWEGGSTNDTTSRPQQNKYVMMRTTGPDSHNSTPRSSLGPYSYSRPPHSLLSDTASSFHDRNSIRGLSIPERPFMSPQINVPSIRSQLYSSPSSSPPLTPTLHGRVGSPEPIMNMPSTSSSNDDSLTGRSFTTHSGTMVRTLEGGTKFIEGL